ncbi:MAG: fibronectin type III-like domain-contianing protein [Firmicutes bacterium]|nr:fibronectin type III-like domain-contianing protein [Bacillota bacterium]
MYISDKRASMLRPAKEFTSCERVFVKAGEKVSVGFHVRANQFAFIDNGMSWVVEASKMNVFISAASNDIRLAGSFDITETKVVDERKCGFYAE